MPLLDEELDDDEEEELEDDDDDEELEDEDELDECELEDELDECELEEELEEADELEDEDELDDAEELDDPLELLETPEVVSPPPGGADKPSAVPSALPLPPQPARTTANDVHISAPAVHRVQPPRRPVTRILCSTRRSELLHRIVRPRSSYRPTCRHAKRRRVPTGTDLRSCRRTKTLEKPGFARPSRCVPVNECCQVPTLVQDDLFGTRERNHALVGSHDCAFPRVRVARMGCRRRSGPLPVACRPSSLRPGRPRARCSLSQC